MPWNLHSISPGAPPAPILISGPRPAASLRALTERLEILPVESARKPGWSWLDIAGRPGVTTQTVHRKHGMRTGSR